MTPSRYRIAAVVAGGELCACVVILAYGDSYSCAGARTGPPAPEGVGTSSPSARIDLPRLLLPDDELDWLSLLGAGVVMIEDIGIRETGAGKDCRACSAVGGSTGNLSAVRVSGGSMVAGDTLAIVYGTSTCADKEATLASPVAACALSRAAISAFVGRPRFFLGGCSICGGACGPYIFPVGEGFGRSARPTWLSKGNVRLTPPVADMGEGVCPP